MTGFKNQLGQDQKDYQKGIESQYDHSGGPQGPGVGQFNRSPAGGAVAQGAPSGFGAPSLSEKAQEANPGKGAAIGQAPPGQRTLGGGAQAAQPQATGFQPIGAGTLFQGGSGAGLALNQSYSRTGPSAQAVANGPQGGKDLESSLGADAWGRLLGQGQKAQDDAAALGSQSGVQGLIQQQAGQPLAQNGAFDAALEYGQGQKQFGQTAKAGQGLVNQLASANHTAQGQWNRLMGDVTEARRQANATAEADATNKAIRDAQAAQSTPAGGGDQQPQWHPGDYTDFRSFMDEGSAGQYAHEGAMDASPVDWIARGLGEAGAYSGENPSQLFAKQFGGNGNQDNTWQIGNLRSAARLVQNEYGSDAVAYWFNHLNPDMWKAYMAMGNAGAMARDMRAWLESAGFHKGGVRDSLTATGTGTVKNG